MTKKEAIKLSKEKNIKITHRFFSNNEWIIIKDNKVFNENGFTSSIDNFFGVSRSAKEWNTGWKEYKYNVFEKYYLYIRDKNGKIIDTNKNAFNLANESFELLKELYDYDYGSIEEDKNLIEIHTGGWSDNEELIREFQKTAFWFRFHEATMRGGHYYFDTDFYASRKWKIEKIG